MIHLINQLQNNSNSLLILLFGVILNGCSLVDLKEQSEFANNLAVIEGKISIANNSHSNNSDIVVVLMKQTKERVLNRVSYVLTDQHGNYNFNTEPGTYVVGAFLDINNDKRFQSNEFGDVYGAPAFIKLAAKQVVKVDISINGKFNKRITYDSKDFDQTRLSLKNIGKVVSLKDTRFKSENGSFGLWRPIDFMNKYGAGLLMLQKYNSKKIPVIFVHGANGGSADWTMIIANLDHKYYQPWVLHYPSGMRLDIISDYFVRAVNELQRKYNMKKIYVVAHSMGGLVARSFVMKYQKKHPKQFENLKFVMTINSPMMGLASADTGVKYFPITVPSWRDVVPESDFLKVIHTWSWPNKLPYHLVFSYLHGEGDDGVVDLESQISLKLQSEAKRIYGFNASHAGILKQKNFIQYFNKVLERSRVE